MARAGRLRERAAFERQDTAGGIDAYGNPSPAAWQPLVAVWGDLRETTGRERIAAGRVEAPATGTLRIRDSAAARAITAADRVTVRGHAWAILGGPVEVDGRLLEFTLERGGAAR